MAIIRHRLNLFILWPLRQIANARALACSWLLFKRFIDSCVSELKAAIERRFPYSSPMQGAGKAFIIFQAAAKSTL
jgi:hypothetical protein